eukprot:6747007-Alexandrium_andersonii.AAC.1
MFQNSQIGTPSCSLRRLSELGAPNAAPSGRGPSTPNGPKGHRAKGPSPRLRIGEGRRPPFR